MCVMCVCGVSHELTMQGSGWGGGGEGTMLLVKRQLLSFTSPPTLPT